MNHTDLSVARGSAAHRAAMYGGNTRTLETTVGDQPLSIEFAVTGEDVDCYDKASGREYTDQVPDTTITAIRYKGTDIHPVLKALEDADSSFKFLSALRMEVEASLSVEVEHG